MDQSTTASLVQLLGAGGFGALIGWYVYYINRYRKGDVQFSDLVTLVGILGGGSVLALFPQRSDLFGAYGIGLFTGFFGYFAVLFLLVRASTNFTIDWFLDGRRTRPTEPVFVPGEIETPVRPPMSPPPAIAALGDLEMLRGRLDNTEANLAQRDTELRTLRAQLQDVEGRQADMLGSVLLTQVPALTEEVREQRALIEQVLRTVGGAPSQPGAALD